ncbi:RimJ/RimL family protein N-acetyltransferase [Sphingomonas naasensis]|uniref:N-acetyltransferase n=1 Tax=Sphingomonas naasensis TaxID=1344951 RepID=A0A4S1W9Q3_9SPHN|nr:GNAT family N-acetyltransferase [Sphingomonas naasensis]NIJ19421.1 RimJ/RimL family protein N-acetyltransferase [Sphingomonas naasensis]TGX39163.1 N-acetyltransferase [Sphingomonas naasensis]
MIIETTAADYAALLANLGPRGHALADSPIAPPEILMMLADVAARIAADFSPASWLIVEADTVVGLCSITRPPQAGSIDIGYGIAPAHRRRGVATRAIGAIVTWARAAPHLSAITAETAIDNIASQRVLERAGFVRVGERLDAEDGQLICWRCAVA